jgi:cyclohexanecarboxylate-CoA ligase
MTSDRNARTSRLLALAADRGTLAGSLQAIIERDPDATAIVDRKGRHSFASIAASSDSLAASLQDMGVAPADIVSWQLPNWIEAIVLHFAILKAGAVSNPLNAIFRERELAFALDQTRAKLLFMPAALRGKDVSAMALDVVRGRETRLVCVGGAVDGAPDFEELVARPRAPRPLRRDAGAPSLLLYTSGTESAPKGVLHSERTLIFDSLTLGDAAAMNAQDVIFSPSPATHISGILYGFYLPFLFGNTACIVDVWDTVAAAKLIEKERCSIGSGATPFLNGLLNDPAVASTDISSLRTYRCGGTDVPQALIRQANERGIVAYRTYGSSEHPTVTGYSGDPLEKNVTTDGRIHDHVELRVCAVDDPDRVLAPGSAGEIQTRGPDLFGGYFDGRLDGSAFGPGGWFRTGDLGRVDEDGFLTITGRKKDIVIRKGENISAREVETIILDHPSVDQAAVIGLPDEERGERLCAVVQLRAGATLDLPELSRFFAEMRVSRQKHPEQLEIIDAMPLTPSGKILKGVIRSMIAGRA